VWRLATGRDKLPRVEIELETCKLRPWRADDAEALARNADDPEVARNMRDAFPHPFTLERAHAWLAKVTPVSPVRFFAIDVAGEAVGGVGVSPFDDIYRHSGEIGY